MQPLLDSYGRPEDRSCHEVEWRENILCGGRHLILWHFEKNGTHHFSLIDHHLQSVGRTEPVFKLGRSSFNGDWVIQQSSEKV